YKKKQAPFSQLFAFDIITVSIPYFERTIPNYDRCLLGPQIKYKFEEFNKKAAAVGKRVAVIDSMDYGMMRG
ncbi:PTS sugar transporter subunit IIB, partial [Klebsiella pneumoniae]|nr:PTS sugar transporter subunit IIB [Klebsiella pneumoniae]